MAFGKRNVVNLDILSYVLCLLGESKIGKTTLVFKVLQKLAGDDGYLFAELGQERGADAIEGINYINCPEWSAEYNELLNTIGYSELIDDIVENKTTEYPNLKVLVWDTYDQLINMAEKEAIRLWNKECRNNGHPEKCTQSINAAWGGFGKGEKKAIEIMFETKSRLNSVGVQTFIIGHCKTKDISDVVTGETYQVVTSDQQQNYFNALKKDIHFLGLAYIDRTIIKQKTGKKNIVTGKEEMINRVTGETRKIKFRDDNYAVDSGSRFADIVPEIEMSPENFIEALENAIKSEQAKSGVDYKTAEKNQKKLDKAKLEQIKEKEEIAKVEAKKASVIEKIVVFFQDNKSNLDIIKPILNAIRELGYANPTEIKTLEEAQKIAELIS